MRITVALVVAAAALVNASPVAQGVTVPVAPSGSPPQGCTQNHPEFFGLSVQTIGSAQKARNVNYRREAKPQVVTSISDGQIQAPTGSPTMSIPPPGYPSSVSSAPSSSISSGISSSPVSSTASPSSPTYSNPTGPVSGSPTSSIFSVPTSPGSGSSSISSTTTIILTRTVLVDCTSSTTSVPEGSTSMIPVTQISDGQIQATNTIPDPTTIVSSPVSQISDGQIQAPPARRTLSPRHVIELSDEGALGFYDNGAVQPAKPTPYTCVTDSTLTINLRNGVLTDRHGRTGYVASNYQVQFDAPPQHGALYTADFTTCSNGSLALGGSTIFWQCLSGNFNNIYDRYWAPQCEPIELIVTKLIQNC